MNGVRATAHKSQHHAEKKRNFYEKLDKSLVWLAALTAGAAGVSALAEGATGLTAGVAFTSAASSFIAPRVRELRVYNARMHVAYKRVALTAEHATHDDLDRASLAKLISSPDDRLLELDAEVGPGGPGSS